MSDRVKIANLLFRPALLLFCLLAYPAGAVGQEKILFLYDQRSPAQQTYTRQTMEKLATLRPAVQAVAFATDSSGQPAFQTGLRDARLIVAAGGTAVRLASQRKMPQARLYALLPRARYQELGLTRQPCQNNQCAVLGIEQPLPRQLRIIRELFGEQRKVGSILGTYTRHLQDEFITACRLNQLDCLTRNIDRHSLLSVLNDLLPELDVFVALPDPSVISPKSVRTLLLATYQQRVPVVAFSKSFVRAGAMLAIYTPLDALSSQTAQLVADYFADRQQFRRRYYPPEEFAIELNSSVARSLKIRINEQALSRYRSPHE